MTMHDVPTESIKFDFEASTDVDAAIEIELRIHRAIGDLEDFLRDPIAFGDYDYSDPISLVEFEPNVRMHGLYIDAIS